MDTQTQIERLIELAIVQRSELKQLVSELPQLREYLSAEIERTFEETEPQIRTELEEFCRARASDEHAKTGAALAAKVEHLSKQLEVTTTAKYSVLMAEREKNASLLAQAEARIEDAASMLSGAVKEIVTDELSRFPRAGEIDQLRKEFAEPRGLNPRGRWMVGDTYGKLDFVSYNGDSYVSNIDGNREKPSRSSEAWTLSAARGNGGGGGGATTLTDLVPVPTNGQLLIGNGSAFVNSTLTAGTGISISNGAGSITINATDGNITLDDGTAAAPSLNFTNEPTTGLFRASANVMGFAVNGVSRATMTTTGVTVTGTITPTGSVHAVAGSVGNPSLAFNADQDTGLFSIGANNIGVAAGGAKVLDIATTGLTVTGALGASSLTSPAATNLTLAGGSSGASMVLGQGANGGATITTVGSGVLTATGGNIEITTAAKTFFQTSSQSKFGDASGVITGGSVTDTAIGYYSAGKLIFGITGGVEMARLTDTGNLLIGTTSSTGLTGAGGLKIASSTAGSSGAGALVVTGGLSAGAASYFGGAIRAGNIGFGGSAAQASVALYCAAESTSGINQYGFLWDAVMSGATTSNVISTVLKAKAGSTITTGISIQIGTAELGAGSAITTNYGLKIENQTVGGTNYAIHTGTGLVQFGGAATFASAVSITGNVGFYGQAATAKPTGVAVTAAAIHAALVTLNLIAA
jgi:hypothetical protein